MSGQQQALALALQQHAEGRLSEAQNIYRQILKDDPDNPEILHLLGVVSYQTGQNDIAIELITKALRFKPSFAEAHCNMGLALHAAGKFDYALASYHSALSLQPNYAIAHNNMGVTLHELGKLQEAAFNYKKAIHLKPDYSEAHNNLADALRRLGQIEEALHHGRKATAINPNYAEAHNNVALAFQQQGELEHAVTSYQQALAIDPHLSSAHANLGVVLQQLGRLDEAVASQRRAVSISPNAASAHVNLGAALQELGKLKESVVSYRTALTIEANSAETYNNLANCLSDLGERTEAIANYRKALDIKPEYAEASHNLGNVLMDINSLKEAENSFKKALSLRPAFPDALASYGMLLLAEKRKGEALYYFRKKLELERGKAPINTNTTSFRFITRAKLRHDIEQFRYLESINIGSHDFGGLARVYEKLETEIPWPQDSSIVVPLNKEHRQRISNSYNRPLHILETPEIAGAALNPDLNKKSIIGDYTSNDPGMTYFDDLLSADALRALQRFLLESTIWYKFEYSGGYVGAMLADGMACPLLLQIAEELRQTFPEIFMHHRLTQLWAYKYDSEHTGINVHADFAIINVNFWITPNSANLDPTSSGLVVYTKGAPLQWNLRSYNSQNPTTERKIRRLLTDENIDRMVVPYAENRVVLFNSKLFHETDSLKFKPGYENRRINVTMLFGKR